MVVDTVEEADKIPLVDQLASKRTESIDKVILVDEITVLILEEILITPMMRVLNLGGNLFDDSSALKLTRILLIDKVNNSADFELFGVSV